MKGIKITYWITTSLVVLFEGVMPALTGNTDMAKEGIRHLGYPNYFRVLLNTFKIAGALLLILPVVKGRFKEWVYAGFTFDFLFATMSLIAVDGVSATALFPLIPLVVLAISYVCYHKMHGTQKSTLPGSYALKSS